MFKKIILQKILNEIPQEPTFRGLESKFQKLYEKNNPQDWSSPLLSTLGMKLRIHGTSGKMDLYCATNQMGLELKVVKILNKSLPPSQALYDIGQLSSDAIDLINCPQVKSGYLLVLFVSETEFSKEEFKNKIYEKFCKDYKTSVISRKQISNLRIEQEKIYQMWNLNQDKGNFLTNLEVFKKLAIGVVQVK